MFSLNNTVPFVLTTGETQKYKKPVMRKAKFVYEKRQYARSYKKNHRTTNKDMRHEQRR
jgi:hypothetical protein